ncbi:hypothetical protein PROP_01744 [Propionicimonas sp. T2.31MG-18]|uniref:hypothetical protein n=1 Tax=Propionicimonas sp. T2.31MG-18 TaxID=3157620 RepID=UPI0035EBE82A
MNGELAALVTLATYGSDWLSASASGDAPELAETNSSFQYVHRLVFESPETRLLGRKRSATGTGSWLRDLRRSRADRIFVVTSAQSEGPLPNHIASAFANGVRWGLLTTGPKPWLWFADWQTSDLQAVDSRIWNVTTSCVRAEGAIPRSPDVAQASETLDARLASIGEFAARQGFDDWLPWFQRASSLLDDPAPVPRYHADMIPVGRPVEQRQLAAAAIEAWVFGGMGSWNDVWLPDEHERAEYDKHTAGLYSAVVDALLAVANA